MLESPIKRANELDLSHSINWWMDKHQIKNEKGDLMTFLHHLFLKDIYEDQSQNLVVTKAAQVGLSTLEVLKNIHDAKFYKMDIIYTLPTDSDVIKFVSGKVNRIIANNPVLQGYTKDRDSIEQKQIGSSTLYFNGTYTKRSANMITADRLVHDEKDSSKQEVVSDYQARMQHSKFKQTHVFSHPSTPNHGVDVEWQKSDQKEWFIKCPHCTKEQYLEWNTENPKRMSIDIVARTFICKYCHGILSWKNRAKGRWRKKYTDFLPNGQAVKWSGYHISLLMAPWVTAGEIVDKYKDPKQAPEFFYNKVLGLAWAGSGNSVTEDTIMSAITTEQNEYKGRMIIGVDTGIKLRYVIGNKQGLVGFGEMDEYEPRVKTADDPRPTVLLENTLEYFLKKFPQSIMVIDQNGDIKGSRSLQKKYPGRVFLCNYHTDKDSMDLVKWGDKDNFGVVYADRNRLIQLVIDEFVSKGIKLFNGTKEEWYDYWLHWSHIHREIVENDLGNPVKKWRRSDRDDWVHATVYWRVGLMRFGNSGGIALAGSDIKPNSYMVNANDTVDFDPAKLFGHDINSEEDAEDWR